MATGISIGISSTSRPMMHHRWHDALRNTGGPGGSGNGIQEQIEDMGIYFFGKHTGATNVVINATTPVLIGATSITDTTNSFTHTAGTSAVTVNFNGFVEVHGSVTVSYNSRSELRVFVMKNNDTAEFASSYGTRTPSINQSTVAAATIIEVSANDKIELLYAFTREGALAGTIDPRGTKLMIKRIQ